ncbi:hypothetical protein MAPG_09221 [Magnaporthiopsis poae ATCC 64411]|uniref:Uncharacterized protein n=1 Tax=Magnaporthiopsis poae (strain ATCC 64411 / 73-15) TaxID=644358 RepID=A0A0C4E9D9_MAGP6|nr:hypothetical protein MAPG_09221 [Magnaporthiopsis poae ATCC 64411]
MTGSRASRANHPQGRLKKKKRNASVGGVFLPGAPRQKLAAAFLPRTMAPRALPREDKARDVAVCGGPRFSTSLGAQAPIRSRRGAR